MEENGVWRTVGGRRIFIKEGQDLASAMKESGKFKKNKKENWGKDKIMETYRKIKKNGTHEELQELAEQINNSDEINQNDKDNLTSVLGTTDFRQNNKRIENTWKQLKKEKNDDISKTNKVIKNIADKKEEISNNINEAINDLGEDGRFDVDKNTEELYQAIWDNAEKILGRELKEEDFDYIDNQLSAYYKDGFYVSKGSFSLKEYENRVNPILDKVEYELSSRGWETQESHSQYAGLVTSRYFTKDGITIRIGDHTNSNGSMPSHTREQLFNSNVNDLVKYVEDNYENRKKTKN